MFWEQSRGQRTIAASRSDDNPVELHAKKATTRPRRSPNWPRSSKPRKDHKNRQRRQVLPLRTNPEKIEFNLTDSFRNGPLDGTIERREIRAISLVSMSSRGMHLVKTPRFART